MLSCIGKITERTAAELLLNDCEERNLLHNGQYGNRRGRAATDAVAVLMNRTMEDWKQKKMVGVPLMDVQAAFPNVSKEKPVSRMQQLGIEADLIR